MPTALISGITGQDGSYLAELLLRKGYKVHGIIRRSSSFNTSRIDHLYQGHGGPDLFLHYGDILDASGLRQIITAAQPDEVYNLAAQSHVKTSFDQPVYTAETVYIGTVKLLEAVRDYRDSCGHEVRFYQASSSEMFGNGTTEQDESTPFRPCSPYACAKVAAYWQVVNYREAYGLLACNGILFNHESPRRGETFVTRKITRAATRIKLGLQDKLTLGNVHAVRDWGFAGDYVRAMWLMLQNTPDDFVVATGKSEMVSDFAERAFKMLGLDWEEHVEYDKRLFRPNEVNWLCGNPKKIGHMFGWSPEVSIMGLTQMMVDGDLALAKREQVCKQAGV